MGRGAFGPLRDALSSEDPDVRREALRSIGKLKERAPLDAGAVLPLLIDRDKDSDPACAPWPQPICGIIQKEGPMPSPRW